MLFQAVISSAENVSGNINTTLTTDFTGVTEAGHAQSDFDAFLYIKITLPDGTTYIMGTSEAGAIYTVDDAGLIALSLQLESTYINTFGDGLFDIELWAVPTYDAAVSYVSTSDQKIYYGGAIWEPLQNGVLPTPVAGPNWADITSSFLANGDRYKASTKIGTLHDTQEIIDVIDRRLNNFGSNIAPTYDRYLLNSMAFDDARLKTVVASIPELVALSEDARVVNLYNYSRSIINKY